MTTKSAKRSTCLTMHSDFGRNLFTAVKSQTRSLSPLTVPLSGMAPTTVLEATMLMPPSGSFTPLPSDRMEVFGCVARREPQGSSHLRLFSLCDYFATKLGLKLRRVLRVGKAIEQMPTVVFAN